MRILAIETSCDETAVAVLECEGDESSARFKVLGNVLLSQIDLHKEYGGVFPALAKREHAKNLVPVLAASLEEAGLHATGTLEVDEALREELSAILSREPELLEALLAFLASVERPDIDAIAVTRGPGLAPALWVGVNLARSLARAWDIPLVGANHMEGHLLSALAKKEGENIVIQDVRFPVLALLISGGHTELVLMRDWLSYELLGATRDDAVGEAFDKVARMLGLPYPGGPEVSRLAERNRAGGEQGAFSLPRPMLESTDLDFSFSGLKTSVLYLMKERPELRDEEKEQLAREFEDAAAEVLVGKTVRAIASTGAKTVVAGGGVSANIHLQRELKNTVEGLEDVELRIPPPELTTDNAVMIGLAGFYRASRKEFAKDLSADGNLALARKE